MDERALYRRAAKLWGVVPQLVVMIEESSELTKEVCKYLRFKFDKSNLIEESFDKSNLIEEIADTQIMLDQLKTIFACDQKVEVVKIAKLVRLDRTVTRLERKE